MKTHQQHVNPRQQSDRRHNNQQHDHYDRDQMQNLSEGGDFYEDEAYGTPNGFHNRDYSNANYNFWPQRDEPQYSNNYTPASNYGYERDEYQQMDPSRSGHRQGQATGYGNDNSEQSRDFERMRHESDRNRESWNRNSQNRDFQPQQRNDYHRDEENHRYSHREEPQQHRDFSRHEHPNYQNSDYRAQQHHNDNYHPDHSHGRNDYNRTRGYGHNDRRSNTY